MKTWIAWVIRVAVIAGLIAGIVYANRYIRVQQQAVEAKKQAVLQQPEDLIHASTLKAELSKHQFDIDRIRTYVLKREEIAEAVGWIEGEGQKLNVSVTVSDIKEVAVLDAAGNPLPQTGPLQKISLEVVGSGLPSNVLSFLHQVEHAPYLIYMDKWAVSSSTRPGSTGVSSAAPSGNEVSSAPAVSAVLSADVIMFVHSNEAQ
ncbi:MAG: hypothetical protein WEC84_01645 [Candidatus Andersenbacteria bacterium]